MSQVGTVIRKEWEDGMRNKTVLSVVIIVPLVMTALPVVMLFVMGRTPVIHKIWRRWAWCCATRSSPA